MIMLGARSGFRCTEVWVPEPVTAPGDLFPVDDMTPDDAAQC